MAAGPVIGQDETSMRWDLLGSMPPTGGGVTARLAIPSQSTEVFIAVDAAARRYTLVRIPDGHHGSLAERISRGIAVQTVEMKLDRFGESGVFVEIACLEQSGWAALDTVTIELVEAIKAGASIGRIRLVQTVLTKWRRFWSGIAHSSLSREQHLGLFGELWFLARWLLPSIGAPAIQMWRGPIGARNDFEKLGWAVEVKTSGKLDGSHHINGLEQLLAPPKVDLFLFSLMLRDEASGIESLPDLITEIREAIAGDHIELSQFESMLAAAGYDDAQAHEYEKVKFRIRSQCLYHVLQGFPRLVPADIPAGLPLGIGNVNYDLRLDGAGQWLVAEEPMAYSASLKKLAIGPELRNQPK